MADIIHDRPGGGVIIPSQDSFQAPRRADRPIRRLYALALSGALAPIDAARACRRLTQPAARRRVRAASMACVVTLRYCWRNLPPAFANATRLGRATYALAMATKAFRAILSGDLAVIDTTPMATTVAEARAYAERNARG